MKEPIRLACSVSGAGGNIYCVAVSELDEAVAKDLLHYRPIWEAAYAMDRRVFKLEALDYRVDFYDTGDLGEGDLDELEYEWEQLLEVKPNDDGHIKADVYRVVVRDSGVCFTAYLGDYEVETAELSWANLEAVVAGGNPFTPYQEATA